MVAGHVGLDISCLDWLYLTGFVAILQTPGEVIYFLHDHRGNPIASPALFERIGDKFRTDVKAWAQANGVSVITFKAGESKVDVMAFDERNPAVDGTDPADDRGQHAGQFRGDQQEPLLVDLRGDDL
jgi:hypothetical protein